MAGATQKTQPESPSDILDSAIHLAKTGQKATACDMLRRIVALQPVNQAAWLWLSAVAPERAEAEAALAQARQINAAHPALPQAEQWFAKRFSDQVETKATPIVTIPVDDEVEPQAESLVNAEPRFELSGKKLLNGVAMSIVVVALFIGLVVLCIGLIWEVTATAQASVADTAIAQPQPEPSTRAEPLLETDLVNSTVLAQAWAAGDWAEVIALAEEVSPEDQARPLIRQRLAQAHFYHGLALRQASLIEAAQAQFEAALKLDPEEEAAQHEADLAQAYLTGKIHHQKGAWPDAIAALEAIYEEDVAYPNVKDLLFSAYYNQGLRMQANEQFGRAQRALQSAIALHPDLAEPRLRLAEIDFAKASATPPDVALHSVPLAERLVLVGIAEQRMHVYEGGRLVYDFIVSTGEPGRDTAMGEFEIQNKIDVAYASTWNLDMPFWMGIYWSGPLQNGIHSLPTVRHTGQTLWDGYLGQRVSYGCVILGHDDSATLFDWAEVGTKVKIVPNLTDWKPDQ